MNRIGGNILKSTKFVNYLLIILLVVTFTGCREQKEKELGKVAKPVIYFYPEEKTEISVTLDYDGYLTCTYPVYEDGWNVVAYPDGTLIDTKESKEYSYLYWEGITDYKWNIDKGFIVKGSKTAEFLQDKLSYLGLNPREYNEFIVFWLPRMQENEYNLIYFAEEEYENLAELYIDPKPMSILRVFMVFEALDKPIQIQKQELKPFTRTGFTAIEWGGTEIE